MGRSVWLNSLLPLHSLKPKTHTVPGRLLARLFSFRLIIGDFYFYTLPLMHDQLFLDDNYLVCP